MSVAKKHVTQALYNPIDNPPPQVVTAGTVDLLNHQPGVCQVCGKQMVLTTCLGTGKGGAPVKISVYACLDDRIVLPLKQ